MARCRVAPAHSTLPQAACPALPVVSIHLPVSDPCPGRIRGILARLALLDNPAFEVLVVDHDTAEPQLWEAVARDCARLDARFRFFHLGRCPGGRAGALNFARTQTAYCAQLIVVADDDTIIPHDWLSGVVPLFADPWIGAVRSPIAVRKDALDAVGGWAEWCIDEAAALEVALLRKRWYLARWPRRFTHRVVGFGEHQRRVARLAYGAAQILRKQWRPLFSPFDRELASGQRWAILAGWARWAADALSLPPLFLNLALAGGFGGLAAQSTVAVLTAAAPVVVLLAIRLARSRRARPGGALVGLALSHTAAKAFWSAMLGRPPPRMPPGTGEELALLLLTWTVLAGLAHDQSAHGHPAHWQAGLWCALLFLQSLPYLAAVCVGALAAIPAGQPVLAWISPGLVARTGAGD